MSELTLSKYSDLAYNAYRNTSFSPEKRRDTIIREHSEELDSDLEKIKLEVDRERYKAGYEKRFCAWLSAKGRCASSMITGPANFPVARAEKANRMEEKRGRELFEYREKVFNAIARREKREAKAEENKDVPVKESEVKELNGVMIVTNYQDERVQLFFNGKPDDETRGRLKKNAWKWSPRNICWQRKLTRNAQNDAEHLLKQINP